MTGKGGWPIAVDGEAEKLIDNELWNGQCETVIMKNVSLGSAFFYSPYTFIIFHT